MYFVDNNSAVPVMPQVKPVSSATPLYFTEGGNGVPPTWPGPDWFNIFQTELLNILKEAGINPDKANHAQLLAAMKKLLLSRSNPFGDIKADGPAAIATALANLGLGEGSALPVGVPIPWPSATPPTGWLKCNGAAFTASQYPKLAQAYPALRLPDLRGEFIRGWDGGRGVDQGRTLLSNQSDAFASHNHYIRTTSSVTSSTDDGDPARGQIRGSANTSGGVGSDNSIGMSGGSETRPRNIAFNYIVRAA